jgi:hypothetical protein
MKYLLFILLFLTNIMWSQDTVIHNSVILIYHEGKIQQKIFNDSKNQIKIVYYYDSQGVLRKRIWYNSKGNIISICLDN